MTQQNHAKPPSRSPLAVRLAVRVILLAVRLAVRSHACLAFSQSWGVTIK